MQRSSQPAYAQLASQVRVQQTGVEPGGPTDLGEVIRVDLGKHRAPSLRAGRDHAVVGSDAAIEMAMRRRQKRCRERWCCRGDDAAVRDSSRLFPSTPSQKSDRTRSELSLEFPQL